MSKILILGAKRHGKDCVGELIAGTYGVTFTSSSMAALDAIFPVLQIVKGYKTKEEAFEDRHDNRLLWKELICLYNSPDKASLAKEILKTSDIYVGMRCIDEFNASKYLFDHIIWVDAFERVGTVDESLTIPNDKENFIQINNNYTMEHLVNKIYNLSYLFK